MLSELGQEFQRVEDQFIRHWSVVICQLSFARDQEQRTKDQTWWQSRGTRYSGSADAGEALLQVAALQKGLHRGSTTGRQKPHLAANRSS